MKSINRQKSWSITGKPKFVNLVPGYRAEVWENIDGRDTLLHSRSRKRFFAGHCSAEAHRVAVRCPSGNRIRAIFVDAIWFYPRFDGTLGAFRVSALLFDPRTSKLPGNARKRSEARANASKHAPPRLARHVSYYVSIHRGREFGFARIDRAFDRGFSHCYTSSSTKRLSTIIFRLIAEFFLAINLPGNFLLALQIPAPFSLLNQRISGEGTERWFPRR